MNKRLLVPLVLTGLLLNGCLTRAHKQLDIAQRRAQLTQLDTSIAYMETQPRLGRDFGGEIFISNKTWNTFLEGLDDYEIKLESPKNSTLIIKKTRLTFANGTNEVSIDALARHDKWPIELKVRLGAELVVEPDPQNGRLVLSFRILRLLPEAKLSIFRIREFIFAQRLMRIEAQKLADTLPEVDVPLKPEFRIDLSSRQESWVKAGEGRIKLETQNPPVHLAYSYLPARVLMLDDGLHLFLTLSEGRK